MAHIGTVIIMVTGMATIMATGTDTITVIIIPVMNTIPLMPITTMAQGKASVLMLETGMLFMQRVPAESGIQMRKSIMRSAMPVVIQNTLQAVMQMYIAHPPSIQPNL